MASESILLRPSFWYFFIGLVIVVLFIYGMRISQDRTDLTKAKKDLEQRNEELATCKEESEVKSNKISELNKTIRGQQQTITEQSNSISQNETTISDLQARVTDLENRPPRIEYRNKPEPYHPYGKGNGKLTLYKTCNCYNLKFWIDGEYAGQTKSIFSSYDPSCGQEGTVSKIVLAGKHRIQGEDQENHSWDFYVTVTEDQCLVKGVK